MKTIHLVRWFLVKTSIYKRFPASHFWWHRRVSLPLIYWFPSLPRGFGSPKKFARWTGQDYLRSVVTRREATLSAGGRWEALGDVFGEHCGEKKPRKWWNMGADPHFMFFFWWPTVIPQLFAQPGQVNGNHDNWVCGGPGCGDVSDNFGIGQMQWLNRSASSGVKNMVQPLWGMENPERMVLSDFWLLVSFMFFWFSPEMGWRSPWQADVDGMRSHQPWNLSRIHWTLMKLWDVRHIIVWGSEHGAWYRRYPKMVFFGGKLF